jgi:hypothetical protein
VETTLSCVNIQEQTQFHTWLYFIPSTVYRPFSAMGGAPHRVALFEHSCTFGFGNSSFWLHMLHICILAVPKKCKMWIIWWSQKLETSQDLQATSLVASSACDFNANEKEPELHPDFQAAALWACKFHANGKSSWTFPKLKVQLMHGKVP